MSKKNKKRSTKEKKIKKVVIYTIAIFLMWLVANNSNTYRSYWFPGLYADFIEFFWGHNK